MQLREALLRVLENRREPDTSHIIQIKVELQRQIAHHPRHPGPARQVLVQQHLRRGAAPGAGALALRPARSARREARSGCPSTRTSRDIKVRAGSDSRRERRPEAADGETSLHELKRDLEALLFAAGDPVPVEAMVGALDLPGDAGPATGARGADRDAERVLAGGRTPRLRAGRGWRGAGRSAPTPRCHAAVSPAVRTARGRDATVAGRHGMPGRRRVPAAGVAPADRRDTGRQLRFAGAHPARSGIHHRGGARPGGGRRYAVRHHTAVRGDVRPGRRWTNCRPSRASP